MSIKFKIQQLKYKNINLDSRGFGLKKSVARWIRLKIQPIITLTLYNKQTENKPLEMVYSQNACNF